MRSVMTLSANSSELIAVGPLQAALQSISFHGLNKVIEKRNELIEEILELLDCFDSLQVHFEFPEWQF